MATRRKADTAGTIEAALRRLEEIADALQEGTLPLEDSLKLYEEGLELTKKSAERLQTATLTVKRLEKDFEGTMKSIQEQLDNE